MNIKGASAAHTNKFAGSTIKTENMPDQILAEELHQTVIRIFEKRKVHSSFIGNIWDADLAVMQLISKFHKGILFIYGIDINNKISVGFSFKK